ncbi:MAG TPA: alpha/beta hydrolase-fold protein [Tepidisphaeraceae bacterium]|nr:alpha/beta hydrolase-fold protein [Tepidisphaeraceae bacterium]
MPSAQSVQLEGGQGLCQKPVPMVKGENGVWNLTIGPTLTGFHYYWFNVDGTPMNDPGSETFFGYGKETSGIEIPDPMDIDNDLPNVPVSPVRLPFYAPHGGAQGQLQEQWYLSKITGKWRRCFIYTPPGYNGAANSTRYPVLYLQHGAGEDETGWARQGRVNFILDNLISPVPGVGLFAIPGAPTRPKTKPMIAVIDNGYATYAEQTAESPSRDPSTQYLSSANEAFGSVVINELIPMIDSTYRTISDREHRAMAGLSMGAMQTMAVALTHLETFSYIGGYSLPFFGAPPRRSGGTPAERPVPPPFDPKQAYGGVFADAATFNQKVHLLWFGAGTAELGLNATLRENVDKLTVQGIKSVLYQAGGSAHEWQTWRHCLNEFAPLLFQA